MMSGVQRTFIFHNIASSIPTLDQCRWSAHANGGVSGSPPMIIPLVDRSLERKDAAINYLTVPSGPSGADTYLKYL
jgi:hypothetical protein